MENTLYNRVENYTEYRTYNNYYYHLTIVVFVHTLSSKKILLCFVYLKIFK